MKPSKLVRKFRQILEKVDPMNWATILAALMITLLLLTSLGRVVVNARNNYEVYIYEQESLRELEQENRDLQRELAYYQSYEYKKLYARDHLSLIEPGEVLYKVVEDPKYLDIRQKQIQFFQAGNYARWWQSVL